MARRPYGINPSTRLSGPLVGSRKSGDGLYRNVPLGEVDRTRANYQTWVEDFQEAFVTGQLILNGAHVDDLNTATAPTQVVTSETGYLLINPGTKASAGSSVVFDIAPTAAALGNSFNTIRSLTSTTTLMLNRELIWLARVGVMSDTTVWDGQVIMGWLTADTTPMVDATGVPSLATGGGLGFHIGQGGVLSYFSSQAAVTAVPSTTATPSVGTLTAATPKWYELGIRAKWGSTITTGTAEFYVNNNFVGRITDTLPMQSTQVYASTFAIQNGPAAGLSDLTLDWLTTAITGPGR